MNKRLKIGIVCYPTYGGSGVVATELGIALANKGHEIHFISYSQPFRLDTFSENIYFHEVNVPDYPLFEYAPYELNLTSKLVDVVMHENLNLLHVHYAIPHASAALFAQQILHNHNICIPIITTLHGTDITLLGKDKSFKSVIEYSINKSDRVTAVSKSLKEETLNSFNINREIDVIPNFIDSKLYYPDTDFDLRNKYAKEDKFIITHISNFRKVKRVDDVIYIFEKIRKEVPAKLLMIGDGPERLQSEQLCRKLNLSKHIKYLGKLKIIEKILSISDLFVLPSEKESFGLVALEAMASKVAIISSDTGGLPEVNINGDTGYLSKVGDIQAMAEKSIKLLSDINLLDTFKDNAYNHSKKFDLPDILPKYENLYSQVINSSNV